MSSSRLPALAGLLALLVACAPPATGSVKAAQPPAETPAVDVVASAAPSALPPRVPATPLGPDAVRCGVDDSPLEIGLRDRGAPPTDGSDRNALGVSFARGRVVSRPFPSFQLPQPTTQGNAALDPGLTLFTIGDVRRDERVLAEDAFPRGLLGETPGRPRERLLPCALGPAQNGSTLTLTLQIAASGLPVAAIARAPVLTAVQSRCLGEMSCQLTVPPRDGASTLVIEGKIAFTAPTFRGTASVSTRRSSRGLVAPDPAFQKLDRALTKIALACARATPPMATFTAELSLLPNGRGQLSPGSLPSADAAGAILGCMADHLGEAPTVSMATLREDLITNVTVNVGP